MSRVSLSSFVVLYAALSACAGTDTSRMLTAPDLQSVQSELSAGLGASYTLDGAPEAAVAAEDATAQLAGAVSLGASAQQSSSPRAATGSRTTGHVGLPSGIAGTGILSEKYSFSALSIDPATPFGAKGHFEVKYTTAAGDVRIHGDVVCMLTFANTARAAGQITRVWRNGVQSPITANTHAFWVVVDNGEGQATPDQVSLMRFSNAATAQTYCSTGFGSVVFPNQEGNIQVQ